MGRLADIVGRVTDRAVPNLASRDLDRTAAFYAGFGFVPTHRDDGWLIMKRGDVQLEFFLYRDLDPASSSFMCSIRVADLSAFHAAIVAAGLTIADRGIPRLTPISIQSWGGRGAFLIDVDGTQLTLIDDRG